MAADVYIPGPHFGIPGTSATFRSHRSGPPEDDGLSLSTGYRLLPFAFYTHTGGTYIFDVLNGLCGIIAIIITIILNTAYANFDNNLYTANNDFVYDF